MMRRTGTLAISTFGFGHPDLATEFGQASSAVAIPAEAKPKVTKMPNGARVITHDRNGAQTTVGFFVKAGAKFDPSNKPGLNMVLRFSLTNSNMENSHFQVDRNARSVGSSYGHGEIRKEWLSFKSETRRDMWQLPFEDLCTCISAPRLAPWDTEKFRDTMDNLLEEQRWTAPRDYVVDQLETQAFWKQPLGSPRMVPPYANDMCNHKALLEQWSTLVVPSNIVIAGVNVEHEELVAAYQNSPYPHSAEAPHHRGAKPLVPTLSEFNQYAPREFQEHENREVAKMGTYEGIDNCIISAFGLPLPAGASQPDSYANVLVLNELMAMAAGESLLSSGDDQVLGHVRGHQSFSRSFSTASLIGFTAQSELADATKDIIESNRLLTKGISITPENVKIAQVRAATKFYHNNMEYQRDYADYLGTNMIADSTNAVSTADALKAIEATTASGINTLYKSALEAKPSLYATGPVTALPTMRQMGL